MKVEFPCDSEHANPILLAFNLDDAHAGLRTYSHGIKHCPMLSKALYVYGICVRCPRGWESVNNGNFLGKDRHCWKNRGDDRASYLWGIGICVVTIIGLEHVQFF